MPVEMQVVVIQTELKIKRTAVQVLQKLFVHFRVVHTNSEISRRTKFELGQTRHQKKKGMNEEKNEHKNRCVTISNGASRSSEVNQRPALRRHQKKGNKSTNQKPSNNESSSLHQHRRLTQLLLVLIVKIKRERLVKMVGLRDEARCWPWGEEEVVCRYPG